MGRGAAMIGEDEELRFVVGSEDTRVSEDVLGEDSWTLIRLASSCGGRGGRERSWRVWGEPIGWWVEIGEPAGEKVCGEAARKG